MSKARCSSPDLVPGNAEPSLVAVIGIGDRLAFAPRNMVEEQTDPRDSICRSHCLEIREITLIKRQDMGKEAKIGQSDLPGTVSTDLDPMPARDRLCPQIGWVPSMPATGTGGID